MIEIIEERIESLQSAIDAGMKFGSIYADPPWQYGNQATRSSTDKHYSTMSLDAICALPVGNLAADQSHLHLWTTNAFLFDSKRVIDAWGFDYKSVMVMVWVKPQMGIGNYWRVSHEFLLLATRGGLGFPPGVRDIMSWQQVDRKRHSGKPQHFRKLVERVSPGPRLELFARERHLGWAAWGDEIDDGIFADELR